MPRLTSIDRPRLAPPGVAITLALLLPIAAVPDSVVYHQLLALAGWGVMLVAGLSLDARRSPSGSEGTALTVSLATGSCIALSLAVQGLEAGRASLAGHALVVAAACAVLGFAAWRGAVWDAAIGGAWWIAGVLCTVVAFVQYFFPDLADGHLVAANGSPGRAIGNLRQPNHLATALLCAIVMTAWLWQNRRLSPGVAAVSIAFMVLAVVLSASRTGAISLVLLLLWAMVDRSLPRGVRWTLALSPLVYGIGWLALSGYAEWRQAHFFAAERMLSDGDISSSRFAIWSNALALVAEQPWAGVGWGRFNFAWTFTSFASRPVAFFDHTHNLPLQLAVEIGLPATAAILGLLAWSLWRARGAWAVGANAPGHPARAALVMLTVLGVHSLLEYPLWYSYFLLPAAWALGVYLGSVPGAALPAGRSPRAAMPGGLSVWPWRAAGVLMLAGAAYAAWDHRRIEAIYAPPAGAPPLGLRIAEGRRSLLFGHHADYAAVTNPPHDVALSSFRRPLHQLVDVRLLIAYIEALRAHGENDKALYAAQRLREFRRDDAQAYFAACTPQNPAPPFQCETRPVALTWRDLEP